MDLNIEIYFRHYSGIYAIRSYLDDRFYIGSAVNFWKRYSDHKNRLKNNKHPNRYLQAYSNKYGLDKLYFDLLYLCKNTCLVANEKLWIEELKPQFNMRKIIQRPHFEDEKKYDIILMRNAMNESDNKIKEELEKSARKRYDEMVVNYKDRNFHHEIPGHSHYPMERIKNAKIYFPENGLFLNSKERRYLRSVKLSDAIKQCREENKNGQF